MNDFSTVTHLLSKHRIILFQSPTGSGKSTQLPLVLNRVYNKIILVQPRRAASRLLARRMASIRNEQVGGQIGYQLRLDSKVSTHTQIIVMTSGVLLRRLQSDPMLEGVDVVILDEFHERSTNLDLLLIFLREVQEVNPSLKLILCSATLDITSLNKHMPTAHPVIFEGAPFQITINHLNKISNNSISKTAAQAVIRASSSTLKGHILVFLPGIKEIRECESILLGKISHPIFRLHGRLAVSETDKALAPSDVSKVILSTNIAESSVTIPNVTLVIDSGLERIAIEKHNTQELITQRICLDAAKQRSGRSGRTTQGTSLRLWTKGEEAQFSRHRTPEIQRVSLLPPLLMIYLWGGRPEEIEWLTPPSAGKIQKAKNQLIQLNLVKGDRLTPLGKQVANLPVSPRMGVFLYKAHAIGCATEATALATVISEGDPYPDRKTTGLWEKIETLANGKRSPKNKNLKATQQQLLQLLGQQKSSSKPNDVEEAVCKIFMNAFPKRVGKRDGPQLLKLSSGENSYVSETAERDSLYVIAIQISQRDRNKPHVHQYLPIEKEWIPTKKIHRHWYDKEAEKVVSRSEDRIGSLIIHNRDSEIDLEIAGPILESEAKVRPTHFINLTDNCQYWLSRIRFLAREDQSDSIPTFDDWTVFLKEWCSGRYRRSELRNINILNQLKQQVDWKVQQKLMTDVPEFLTVPSGANIQIQYPSQGPPLLSARIQQLFGLNETPIVLGAPIQVQLLAPNSRPQQLTRDMASFWTTTYPILRKELRGRYPKHAWPEHPTAADAQNRPKRRR